MVVIVGIQYCLFEEEGRIEYHKAESYFPGACAHECNPIHDISCGGGLRSKACPISLSSPIYQLLPPLKLRLTLRLASSGVSVLRFPPSLEHHLHLDYTGLVVRRRHRTRWPVSSHHRPSPSFRAGEQEEEAGPFSNSSTA